MTSFPNKAGAHADTNAILRAELKAAGIPTLEEEQGKPEGYYAAVLEKLAGEVKTNVQGSLHHWSFKRAWYYWIAEGPGLDIATAMALHAEYGKEVRVNGDAGCQSPLEAFHGLGVGCYHVDSAEGLKALADAIKSVVGIAHAKYAALTG